VNICNKIPSIFHLWKVKTTSEPTEKTPALVGLEPTAN
jgi:hypothetical protein